MPSLTKTPQALLIFFLTNIPSPRILFFCFRHFNRDEVSRGVSRCHEELRCRVTRLHVSRLSMVTTHVITPDVLATPALHRSWEQVHTSAAPFFRHLLLPSSQQPRNNTTEILTQRQKQNYYLKRLYQNRIITL